MNILVTKFPHNSLLGGGELHTQTLVVELKKLGHSFGVLTSDSVLADLLEAKVAVKKIHAPLEPVSAKALLLFPFTAPFFFLCLLFFLLKNESKYDVLFCLSYTEKILITPVAKKLGMKVFWMEHVRVERSYKQNPLRPLYIWNSKKATVVTVSKSVGQQLLELGISEKNIKVIYNGVDIERFQPIKEKKETKKVVIGIMARLCKEKAIDTAIRGFAKAHKKNSNIYLKIAGTGPEEATLKRLAKELLPEKSYEFVGFQQKPEEFLQQLDIYMLVSRAKESFGLAAAEAMATRVPVIATRLSGLKEVVKDLETGILVDVEDNQQISDAILQLCKSPEMRQKMGKAGRARVEKNFSKKTMIDRFDKLFKSE